MRLAPWALSSLLLVAAPAVGQESSPSPVEVPEVEPRPEDVATIDGIVRAFYEVISGPVGEPRDWGRDATLYLPGITFTPLSTDPATGEPRGGTISKREFIENADAWLVDNGFVEREIGRSVTRFGNVAHVWSAYEWETADGQTGRGVNGIHLYRDADRWWITHATWDEERAGNPIPPEWIDTAADTSAPAAPRLIRQASGTDARLIGVDAVDERVAWVAGTGGTWGRTVDGGSTWTTGVVPGADSLQFRDVHATSAETAFLLSIGEGEASRIYRTDDGGATWDLRFVNEDPDAFFDCLDFWSPDRGIAFSDAVDGEFVLIATDDGGLTWRRLPVDGLPDASEGEGSFAASGTCLVVRGDSLAWFGTGAGASARVFRSADGGRSWSAADAPIVDGTPTTGIASLAFLDDRRGAAFGGDVADPDRTTASVAVTTDGGRTWSAGGSPEAPGAVYGGAFVPGAPTPTLVAVGPSGMALSTDLAATWATIDTLSHWSVTFGGPSTGWAVGPDGRITRIDFGPEAR